MEEVTAKMHVEMAERELGLDPNYPYDPNDGESIDGQVASAHALISIAKSLMALAIAHGVL